MVDGTTTRSPGLKLRTSLPLLDDANGLVPEDRARLEARDRAADEMQVGAADRACRDANQRIGRRLDLRVAHAIEPDIANPMENDGFMKPPWKAETPQAACRAQALGRT